MQERGQREVDEADEYPRLEAVSVIQKGIFGAAALKENKSPITVTFKTANTYLGVVRICRLTCYIHTCVFAVIGCDSFLVIFSSFNQHACLL